MTFKIEYEESLVAILCFLDSMKMEEWSDLIERINREQEFKIRCILEGLKVSGCKGNVYSENTMLMMSREQRELFESIHGIELEFELLTATRHGNHKG